MSCPKVDVRLLSSHWARLFSALMDDVRIDAQGRLRQRLLWGDLHVMRFLPGRPDLLLTTAHRLSCPPKEKVTAMKVENRTFIISGGYVTPTAYESWLRSTDNTTARPASDSQRHATFSRLARTSRTSTSMRTRSFQRSTRTE